MKRIYPYRMVSAQDGVITCEKVGTGYKTFADASNFLNSLVRDQDKVKYLFFEYTEGHAPQTVEINLTSNK